MPSPALADCNAVVAVVDERAALRAEIERLRRREREYVAALGECRYALELSRHAGVDTRVMVTNRALVAVGKVLA